MDLHRTLLKDVVLPKLKSVFVIDYYEGIRRLLESRDDFRGKDFFAKPKVRTRNEIIWSTDAFTNHPVSLAMLNGEEKSRYSYILCKGIEEVRKLIETLKEEEGGAPLSELLTKALSNIDEKSVYCGEEKVVIVNWGLIPRQTGLEGEGIYRSGRFVGGWNERYAHSHEFPRPSSGLTGPESNDKNKDTLNDDSSTNHISATAAESQEDKVDVSDAAVSPSGAEQIHSQEEEGKTAGDGVTPHSSGLETGNSGDYRESTPVESITDKDKTEEMNASSSDTDDATDGDILGNGGAERKNQAGSMVADSRSMNQNGKKDNGYTWRDFLKGLKNGVSFLLRKLWWLLLGLLLLLLILIVFRDCQGPFSQVNPFYNPLPATPVVMPVHDDKIGMSEDGMYQVATDRLNILLEKENDDTMLEWAKAFKKAYPSSGYQIKYYNKDIYMLQVKVPSEDRIKVKKELKSRLPGFKFDVFEESVFSSQFESNDPALADPQASWFFDVIGVPEALAITQGSEDVLVAVVDNGFETTHPEFTGKLVNPYNVLTRNDHLRPIYTEKGINGHGTHVAATAVGNVDNGSGLLGIAPKCRLMPVQVGSDNRDGTMSSTAILEGIMYAINNGADVVNVSLGMRSPESVKNMSVGEQLNYIANSFQAEEAMWQRVFQKAKENNTVIVFAAGNDDIISGIDPKKRDGSTIRVSAVTPDIKKASFSNYGRYPELNREYSTVSAPGVEIYSAYPVGTYQYLQGTSMAAPIVTGTVALMKSVNPSLTAEEIITILQETGRTIDPTIGPMIHAGRAVAAAAGHMWPGGDCERIRAEVQRLRMELDSLGRLCPGALEPADTLKYGDVISDPRSLDGTWKSTTALVNTTDQSPIELYMTFRNLSGELMIVNKGVKFTAPIEASIVNKEIHITQTLPATAPDTETTFVPYTYECSEDRKGYLFCNATSIANQVSFNLIRIK